MVEKFVLIVFEGEYTRVEEHIKEKFSSIQKDELFLIGINRIYIKINADDHDDLFFFRNYEIDDVTKTKYLSVNNK